MGGEVERTGKLVQCQLKNTVNGMGGEGGEH